MFLAQFITQFPNVVIGLFAVVIFVVFYVVSGAKNDVVMNVPFINMGGYNIRMYYPKRDVFTHIDYTKNQYSGNEYLQKYADSIDGMPIDQYTSCRDLHYKIWCIENGEFTGDTWYKLMMISLSKGYQNLLNEILS